MYVLIRQATILDKQSPYHRKVNDVLIENGIIKEIAKTVDRKADQVIDAKDCLLMPGFFDLHVNFREPGFEYKEDIQTGCQAAMAGGFTGVLQMPDTNPPVQSRGEIELIRNKSAKELVDVEVAGAISVGLQGKDLTEMYDMHLSGAKCFTDDKHSVQDAGLMERALLYAKNFGGLIMSFPNDRSVSGKGQVHEGVSSTRIGLKGIPALAEELMVARDLMLCEYTGSGIHFSTISTKGSVALIRAAKAKGMRVTCDVAAYNLLANDTALENFDTNLKVLPPLRTAEDIAALKEGLKDGTIDAICSDHLPEDVENKLKEFDLAAFGAEGLETAFAVACMALKKDLDIEHIAEKFNTAPRRILSMPISTIDKGEQANLTVYHPQEEWLVSETSIKSKSKNNPFIGTQFKGRIKAVFNKGSYSVLN
jgi:dihydroorotase